MTTPTHVPVAGLLVPIQLVPRIIQSFRGTYPALTGDLDDEAAVRAVLKHWVTSTLASYESTLVTQETTESVDALLAEVEEKSQVARERAIRDAGYISESPKPAAPVVAEEKPDEIL